MMSQMSGTCNALLNTHARARESQRVIGGLMRLLLIACYQEFDGNYHIFEVSTCMPSVVSRDIVKIRPTFHGS